MAVVNYYNVSHMEEDPFEEDDWVVDNILSTFLTVLVCIRLFLYLVVVVGDIFLMCVIHRSKKLKTRLNIYIFNCCLLHACLYLKDPLLFIIFYLIFRIENSYYCIEIQSQTAVMCLYFAFSFILAVDWYLSAKNLHFLNIYKKIYIYIIFILYLSFGIEWGISTVMCMENIPYFYSYHTQLAVRTIFYVVLLLVITVINILARKCNLNRDCLKKAYALTVANIIIYSYLPMLIYDLISRVFVQHITLVYIIAYTEFIPEFLGITNNICIIYILGKKNKHFRMAYDRCFRRSVKRYDTENLSDSEEESDIQNTNNSNIVVKESDSLVTETIPVL